MNDSLAREVSNSQFKGRNDIVRINGMSRTNSLNNHGFDLPPAHCASHLTWKMNEVEEQ